MENGTPRKQFTKPIVQVILSLVVYIFTFTLFPSSFQSVMSVIAVIPWCQETWEEEALWTRWKQLQQQLLPVVLE